MGYIEDINPFHGILCAPFYHLWIPIITSFIPICLQMLPLRYVDDKRAAIIDLFKTMKIEMKQKFIEAIKTELADRTVSIDVADIIMQYVGEPSYDLYYKSQRYTRQQFADVIYAKEAKYRQIKWLWILPIIRFIMNLMCCIIVINQYSVWYKQNNSLSHWDKYKAIMIALMYLPNWKCCGIFQIPTFLMIDESFRFPSSPVRILFPPAILDGLIILIALLIGIPFFIPALLFFAGTTCLFGVIAIIMYLGGWCVYGKYIQENGINGWIDLQFGMAVYSMAWIWFMMVSIVCIMEFFNGAKYTDAYNIGFKGMYCDTNDYFHTNKFNEYSWDVWVLIVTWFFF